MKCLDPCKSLTFPWLCASIHECARVLVCVHLWAGREKRPSHGGFWPDTSGAAGNVPASPGLTLPRNNLGMGKGCLQGPGCPAAAPVCNVYSGVSAPVHPHSAARANLPSAPAPPSPFPEDVRPPSGSLPRKAGKSEPRHRRGRLVYHPSAIL